MRNTLGVTTRALNQGRRVGTSKHGQLGFLEAKTSSVSVVSPFSTEERDLQRTGSSVQNKQKRHLTYIRRENRIYLKLKFSNGIFTILHFKQTAVANRT